MGPVITCAARDRIVGLIDRGVAEGAALIVDGRKPAVAGHENGFFVGPTLFDRTTPEMAIYREEIFGPVLVIVRSESLEDAIALINSVANLAGFGAPYAMGVIKDWTGLMSPGLWLVAAFEAATVILIIYGADAALVEPLDPGARLTSVVAGLYAGPPCD
jgi:hypothetical protein